MHYTVQVVPCITLRQHEKQELCLKLENFQQDRVKRMNLSYKFEYIVLSSDEIEREAVRRKKLVL